MSLIDQKSYNDADVVRQLHMDQQSKCYLCERFLTTDYQVEHLKSRENHKEFTYVWDNLFLACGYCNGKKKQYFDSDYSPACNNVEEDITHEINFKNKQVNFISNNMTSGIDITLRLLHRLYNGTNRLRTIREERFFEEFMTKINHFQDLIIEYAINRTELYKAAIIEELQVEEELLGFKFHILKTSSLADEFKMFMVWNKIVWV